MSAHNSKARAGAATQLQLISRARPAVGIAPRLVARRRARARSAVAAVVADDEDLWQYKDRDAWYLPKWAALDQPEWNAARFVRSRQLAPGVRELVLEVEISRERVALRNAYKHVGQAAQVRAGGGAAARLPAATPPFEPALLRDGLLRVRGDMTAGEIKKAVDEGSVKAELAVLVGESSSPDIYKAGEDAVFEVGPFVGTGMDLRGPVAAIFQRPTLVLFVEGAEGIAAARALAEASPEVGGLSFKMRQEVRMYYRAPNAASLCYADQFERWGRELGVTVVTSTRDSFQDMFDDDDTLTYEPGTTAAIVLTGSDEEAEAAALAVCREAEIETVVVQSRGQVPSAYLRLGRGEVDEPTVDQGQVAL